MIVGEDRVSDSRDQGAIGDLLCNVTPGWAIERVGAGCRSEAFSSDIFNL
jgi:hypothetical protein